MEEFSKKANPVKHRLNGSRTQRMGGVQQCREEVIRGKLHISKKSGLLVG
jgi:hypothetical protein